MGTQCISMNATKATIASTPAPLESPHGGYLAAVVVNRLGCSIDGPREAYRDTGMSGGHCWSSPDDALRYAVARAQELIRTAPHRLAC